VTQHEMGIHIAQAGMRFAYTVNENRRKKTRRIYVKEFVRKLKDKLIVVLGGVPVGM